MKFLKEMEKSAKHWLRERNVYFGKKTKVSELNEFLLRVRPKVTSFDLIRIGEDSDGGYLLELLSNVVYGILKRRPVFDRQFV